MEYVCDKNNLRRKWSRRRHLSVCLIIFVVSLTSPTTHADENGCTNAAILLARQGNVDEITHWLSGEENLAMEYLHRNISPSDAASGAVTASPSKMNPDYYYHWVRDAALVMGPVLHFFKYDEVGKRWDRHSRTLKDFIEFSERLQNQSTLTGLGEPKFNVDGSVFNKPWGRPQNDGPALRAILLTRYAQSLIDHHKTQLVSDRLYRADFPATSVIKKDLEYVAHHWKEPSFDIWEEVKGQHFYTLMVQRRSLLDGAALADKMGDHGAASFYRSQATEIAQILETHWDPHSNILRATLNRVDGVDYKNSGLDTAVILGALHGNTRDGIFAPSSDKVLATAARLQERFTDLYPVNQRGLPGVAIGRYPEDKYNGYHTNGVGNPWSLLTHSFAEYHYIIAREFREKGEIKITETNRFFFTQLMPKDWVFHEGTVFKKGSAPFELIIAQLRKQGDNFLLRTKYHAKPDGALSEQINRDTGFQEGADHLTWNYASLLSAIKARRKIP